MKIIHHRIGKQIMNKKLLLSAVVLFWLIAGTQAAEPLILETWVSGEQKASVTVSVPLNLSDFGGSENILGVKVKVGEQDLPSQYDPDSNSLTVSISPQVAGLADEILVWPLVKENEAAFIAKDAVTVSEKDGVIIVRNGKFEVCHDAKKMGGLPSSIQLHGGQVWDQFRMGDRLFQKDPKPLVCFLMHDKSPRIKILKRGPYQVVIRVDARYLDAQGIAPASKPRASYLFTYNRSSLVKIHAEIQQDSAVFWNEQHVVELGFSNREFAQWLTSRESDFAPLLHQAKAGKPQSKWAAFLSKNGGVIALQSPQRVLLFDGEGTIDHYLHGPWRAWTGLSDSVDLTLALIPSEKVKPVADLSKEIIGVMEQPKIQVKAWLTTAEIKSFQEIKNLPSDQAHFSWLLDHRPDLFSSLAARRETVNKILKHSPGIISSSKTFDVPGLTVISDDKQSIAIQQTAEGIGIVNVLATKAGVGFLMPDVSPIWTLEFRFPGDVKNIKKRNFDSLRAWDSVKVEATEKGLSLVWEGIKDWPGKKIRVLGTLSLKNGRSEWDLKVENGSEFILHEVVFPQWELADLATEKGKYSYLMMPQASGVLVKDPVEAGIGIRLAYPSNVASMQCFAYYSDRAALYLASHDARGTLKITEANSHPESNSVTLRTRVPVVGNSVPGNDWQSPAPAVLQVYEGDWFDAAQIYKKWVKAEARWWPREDKKTPKWFREISAWGLTSGNADYVVPRMKKFAKYLEVPTALHWYNWHQHPFDDNYPDYFPAKPGTTEGVKEMQAAGIRVTPYINGLIWDESRDDFKSHAFTAATKKLDGEIYTSAFASEVEFALMCPTTDIWRDKMSEVVGRLTGKEFGFDGVYLDQIAATTPVQCYDASHGHPLGGGHWWHEEGYWPLLEKVRAIAKKNRPDVVLTTEANAETYVKHADGLLSWHFQQDGQVPLFAAVYGGKVQIFGRAYREKSWKGLAMRAHTAQALVFGEQLGWIPPAVVDDPVAGPYLKQLAKLRYELTDYLADGEMLRPPALIGEIPDVTTTWPWYSGDGKVTLKGVQTGAWQAKDGRIVLLFANILDEAVGFSVDYNTEKGKAAGLNKKLYLNAREAKAFELTAP